MSSPQTMASQELPQQQYANPSTTNTVIWAVVPLVFVLVACTVLIYVYARRRRVAKRQAREHEQQQQQQQTQQAQQQRPRRRRPLVQESRAPDEGLNELGQAPPPYPGKTEAGYAAALDLEAGSGPPEYPAVPPRALTMTRRSSV